MMKLTVTPVQSNAAAVQGHCDEGAEPQSQTLIFFLNPLIWPLPCGRVFSGREIKILDTKTRN